MSEPIQLTNVFHWGYTVPDMTASLEVWKDQGAEVVVPPGEAVGLNVICCFILYKGAPIELVAPANDTGRKQLEASLARGGGLDHVCYFTSDMESEIKDLAARGIEIAIPPVYNSHFDRNLTFLVAPTGLVIELMERWPKGNLANDPLGNYLQRLASPA